ncbi:hypothetical protein CHS0354_015174 [Potamilus streckersoni]|uniref:G-protein coupled receptors family 1 profile domain-containing protein n=1 Tax=Potamilus streckersoni TaxID=2493646 RepID=A0AAE0SDG0_9BIVA|nr:hypothetical protein CHS0354_015174 [Potamilus streckersoni]
MGSMTIGIPGNSIVLAIYQKLKPGTNIDCYILSIALLDLVCLVVTIPMYIVMQTQIWDITDVNTFCKTLNFTGQIVTFAESFLLCAMAIERFIKVCRRKSRFFLDQRGKYVVLSIILITFFISVPNLLFSWVDYHRSCKPITNPSWIASAFFLLTVSLFIVMFGIVSFSYANVAMKLLQTANKAAQSSIASRNIMRPNKVTPFPCNEDLRPTTFCMFERIRNETSLSVQTNNANIKISVTTSSSQQMLTRKAACLGREHFQRDGANSDIRKDDENDDKDLEVMGKSNSKSDRRSGRCVRNFPQSEHIAMKVKPLETVVRESFENISLPQKRRLLRTTKVSFLITVTFIISWLPVWIYTVLAFTKIYKDPYGGFFLKQSYLMNSFMNPILFLACNRDFRNKAKGLFFKNQPTITS